MIADTMDPAGKTNSVADVGFVQFGAGMAAIGVHGVTFRYAGLVVGRAVIRSMRIGTLNSAQNSSGPIHRVVSLLSSNVRRFPPIERTD
ncbi:hypothetical protein NBRC116598_07820 [Pseudophaeobacter arcticus]|uniref:Uncharacterized protein n=1 Tax=Pseudophaeobacter arcticus TaxID=385492 RepID=A0ABQ0AHL3_9RHOB